jgi:hypothetical protein
MEVVTSPLDTIPDAARSETMHCVSNAAAERGNGYIPHAILPISYAALEQPEDGRPGRRPRGIAGQAGRPSAGSLGGIEEGQASGSRAYARTPEEAAVSKAAAIDPPPVGCDRLGGTGPVQHCGH